MWVLTKESRAVNLALVPVIERRKAQTGGFWIMALFNGDEVVLAHALTTNEAEKLIAYLLTMQGAGVPFVNLTEKEQNYESHR